MNFAHRRETMQNKYYTRYNVAAESYEICIDSEVIETYYDGVVALIRERELNEIQRPNKESEENNL